MNEAANQIDAARPRRRRWIAALTVAVLLIGYLGWQAFVSPQIEFLRPSFRGAWIVHPSPIIMFTGAPTSPETVFTRRWLVDQIPAQFPVRLTVLGEFAVAVNGEALPKPQTQNWKRGTEYNLEPALRAGQTNEIRVTVQARHAPPALLLEGPPAIRTDERWTVAAAPQFPTMPAVRALRGEGYLDQRPVPKWKLVLLLAGLVFAGSAFLPQRVRPQATPTDPVTTCRRKWLPRGITLFLLLAVVVVHGHNAWQYPHQRSVFDWTGHVEYIQYVAKHWRLPLATDGWEMFQPPLYYFCAATVLKVFGSLKSVQVFSAVVGALHLGLIGWMLRLVFPDRPRARTLGLCVTAILPISLYMNPSITNEVFAATLIGGVLLVTTKVAFRETLSVGGAVLLGGVCGLALLTKYTGLFACASVLILLAVRSVTERRTWKPAVVVFALVLMIAGWFYVRNIHRFGNAFIGNWDEVTGFHYEQRPGYRTLGFFTRFGAVFSRPLPQAADSSFADGMYGSVWADAYETFLRLGNARARTLSELGLWLGWLPSLGVMIGFAGAVRQLIREGWQRPYLVFVLTTVFTVVGLISFTMEAPFYSTMTARFALSLAGAAAVFGGLGLDMLASRLGRWRYLLYANIGLLAALNLYLYWYRGP